MGGFIVWSVYSGSLQKKRRKITFLVNHISMLFAFKSPDLKERSPKISPNRCARLCWYCYCWHKCWDGAHWLSVVGLNIRLQSSLMMLKMMMVMLIMMMMKIVWQRRRLRSSSPPNKLDPTAKLKQLVKTLTSSSKLNNWHKFVKKNHNLFQGCHLTTVFWPSGFFSLYFLVYCLISLRYVSFDLGVNPAL